MITTLITQYKDRMSELKSNQLIDLDEVAMKRLEAIIRSLEAEKKLLSNRLTDANTNNLNRTMGGIGDAEGKVIEKYFFMPDTGLICSSQELTGTLKQRFPDPVNQSFSSIYVTDFESDITSQRNV